MSWLDRLRNWWRPQETLESPPPSEDGDRFPRLVITPAPSHAERKAHQRSRQGGHVPTQINIISG
jgi:hypothetical protein